MLRLKHLALAAVFAAGLLALPAHANIQPGAAAPDFTAKAIDGKELTLSGLKGKTVVLEWSNYDCPFVRMHYSSDNIPNLQSKYTEKDVVWLTVMSSAPGKQGYYTADELIARGQKVNNHATHVLMDADGKIGKLYAAKTTPHIFVIDKAGMVQYNGAIDSIPSSDKQSLSRAEPLAAKAIDAVLAGNEPENAANKPYGCGVKYN